MAQILIANSLAHGFVVFLTAENNWSGDIRQAAVAADDAAAAALLEAAQAAEAGDQVIDPYLVEVTVNGAGPEPIEYREYIRAFGPGVPPPSRQNSS